MQQLTYFLDFSGFHLLWPTYHFIWRFYSRMVIQTRPNPNRFNIWAVSEEVFQREVWCSKTEGWIHFISFEVAICVLILCSIWYSIEQTGESTWKGKDETLLVLKESSEIQLHTIQGCWEQSNKSLAEFAQRNIVNRSIK